MHRCVGRRKASGVVALFLVATLGAAWVCGAEQVRLAWEPNASEEGVTGYVVGLGPTSRGDPAFQGYELEIDVGDAAGTSVTIPDDRTVPYYFSLLAYNVAGVRSDWSEEVTRAAESSSDPPGPPSQSSGGRNGGGGCFVASLGG